MSAAKFSSPPASPPPFTLDLSTGLILVLAFSLMPAARLLAKLNLSSTTSKKLYYLFLWYAYDCLTHSILEAAYLYHCFFSYVELPAHTADYPHPASRGFSISDVPRLYGRTDRAYGSFYSNAPMARLWQEYAKADSRWGGADLTVISIELLTVFGAGPLAAYTCYLIAQAGKTSDMKLKGATEAKIWFVAISVSMGELYGGFMTFAPEWLSGNNSLAGDDPVYLWLYLVFFNMLWVFIPFWIMYEGYVEMRKAFVAGYSSKQAKKAN